LAVLGLRPVVDVGVKEAGLCLQSAVAVVGSRRGGARGGREGGRAGRAGGAARRRAGHARASIARHSSSIRTFCTWLCREGYADADAAARLKAPAADNALPHVLNQEQARLLLSHAAGLAETARAKGAALRERR